jgi:hypothetical protein
MVIRAPLRALLLLLLLLAAPAADAHGAGTSAAATPPAGSATMQEAISEIAPLGAAGDARSVAAGTTCTPGWGSFQVGSWPPGCWHPYGPLAPFNVPIPASPRISSESAAIVKFMKGHGWAFDRNEAGDFTWGVSHGTRPVYWPTRTDPLISVTCRSTSLCTAGMKLHIPAGALPEGETDGHMTVVEQEAGREYDFWRATKPENGQMTTTAGGSIPIGAESGTGLGGIAEAAELGLLGGIIRAAELSEGKIEHALVTTVKCVQLHDVWPSPASGTGDAICREEKPGPRFASLLQLNMTEEEIAASGAPSWQRTIMKAMARYGVYVVDTQRSRSMNLLGEDDLSFTSFGYAGKMLEFVNANGGTNGTLVGVPISTSKLRVIDPCVPQKTC